MKAAVRSLLFLAAGWNLLSCPGAAGPKQDSYWQVEQVRAGMKGQGKTVLKGTRIDTFEAEVLGVLKNTSPGRDLILCRLSGLNLDKTGVIAGMSGSPIHVQGKLLGAVAYAWPFGKEPIAGVTPFCQMHAYVEAYERRDLAEQDQPSRIGLAQPLHIDGRDFHTVTVSHTYDDPQPGAGDGLWMVPLRTPLVATGLSLNSLRHLGQQLHSAGLVPVQGGGVGGQIPAEDKNVPLQAGGALSVALITGDFDLSGVGTVTHIEGKRVYGWGHPFMSLGGCQFPLQTGYTHTVMPRHTLSFKMSSPLRTVGIINADVSTAIAGWLDRAPDLLPVAVTVSRTPSGQPRTFNVQVVRQRTLLPGLVSTVLLNCVDMEGELPEEMTAQLKVTITLEGQPPLVLHDTYSGSNFSGGRAPQALFGQVNALLNLLTFHPFRPVRLQRLDCVTDIQPGRKTAEIEAVELESDTYEPGETVRLTVFLRPFKGTRQRLPLALALPADLAEGPHTITISDDLVNARQELRDNPNLGNPPNLEHLLAALKVQTSVQRTHLVARLPLPAVGVALHGQTLANLPPSMVQILGSGRRTGAQPVAGALVARLPTAWVIQGQDQARITVAKNKRLSVTP